MGLLGERDLPSPASNGPHPFTQLCWRTGMPPLSISWGNDQAWGSRTDRRPALRSDALYRRVMLEVLALSFDSYLPFTKEFQSKQSSWFYFSSCSSEIIKTLAGGRVGHVAGVCSAWWGTVSCQAWSPSLSPPPSPIPGFLPGAAVMALAAVATARVMTWFFIFTLFPPQLSYFFSGHVSWKLPCLSQESVALVPVRRICSFHWQVQTITEGLTQSWEHQVAAGRIIALALMGFSLFLQKCHRHPITLLWMSSPENSPVPHNRGYCTANWPCLWQPQCDQNSYGISSKLSETDCEENPNLQGKRKIR